MAIAKVIEVLAQSDKSWDDAAQQALTEASKTVRNIQSIYVKEFQAIVENDKITQYRLNAKITFLVDGSNQGQM
ncbi:MAG: dodecin domain-containing protein [Caldilineaceae bacterium]|jgi:flavin-binding protein dodecin|nr:dodecin domain-containing protein [Caldilineaceae bacterium]